MRSCAGSAYHSTDPIQEPCARLCRLCGPHPARLAGSYKIGNRSALKDLDHKVGIDDLSVRGVQHAHTQTQATVRYRYVSLTREHTLAYYIMGRRRCSLFRRKCTRSSTPRTKYRDPQKEKRYYSGAFFSRTRSMMRLRTAAAT